MEQAQKKARPCDGVVRRVWNRPEPLRVLHTSARPRSDFQTEFDMTSKLLSGPFHGANWTGCTLQPVRRFDAQILPRTLGKCQLG